ncbi:MAG: transporter substrate-binding domain-containing protein [Bacteroidaceae bacterium]
MIRKVLKIVPIFFLFFIQLSFATEERPYVVLTEGTYPPYDYVDESGKITGFCVDLVDAIFEHLQQPYLLKQDDWTTIHRMVKNGAADLLLDVIYEEERTKTLAFSNTIVFSYPSIVSRKRDDYERLSDVRGKTIFVIKNGFVASELKHNGFKCSTIPIHTIVEGLKMLSDGIGDAILLPQYSAESYVRRYKFDNLEVNLLPNKPYSLHFATGQANKALIVKINKTIDALKQDGTYQKIYDKWFGMYNNNTHISSLASHLFFILSFLIVICGTIIAVLRIRVSKTARLTDQINRYLKLSLSAGETSVWQYSKKTKLFSSLFGYSLPGIKLSYDEFDKYILPEDAKAHMGRIEEILQGKAESKTAVVRFRDPSDVYKLIYFQSSMIVNKEQDKIIGVVGTWRNITENTRLTNELREANLKTMLSLKYADVVTWEYDCRTEKFHVTVGNDMLPKVNSSLADYRANVHPDCQKEMERAFSVMANRQDVSFEFKIHYKRPRNNQWHFGRFIGMPFSRDSSGTVSRYIGCRIDDTEHTLMLHELQKSKEKAERSDKLKTAFLANMSHEIRTPLNAIVGFSDLIVSTTDSQTKASYAKIIAENNKLLLCLINDILDLSKIEAGYSDLKLTTFDLTSVYREIESMYQPKMIEGVLFCCDELPQRCTVEMDRVRLIQILTNFINNAIKFTAKGSITIGFTVSVHSVCLYCSDTGIGITPENKKNVFERFEKLDTFTQGTGLGLSICKAIVKSVNGSIGVDSMPDKGSTFWAVLPCKVSCE